MLESARWSPFVHSTIICSTPPHGVPDSGELANTVLRTLTLPELQTYRSRLIAEFPVYGPLAQWILRSLPKAKDRSNDGGLFPSLRVITNEADRPVFKDTGFTRKLVRLGAPADFSYHAWRHTMSTWLENEGHSEWERGLVLNHSGSGSVTAGYSHGYPLKLKRELLEKWANHVQGLVLPSGVKLFG
jgi:integrase